MRSATSKINPATEGSISIVSVEADAAWDRYVTAAHDSTFCHLGNWEKIMTDVLGHEALYRVAVDQNGSWSGALPLVRVRSRLFGHYLLSMPFLNYGGPIGAPVARAALAEAAAAEGRRSGADLVELRTRQSTPCSLDVSSRKITVLLPLPDSSEKLWRDGFSGKLRSQIRRPQKEGMETRFGVGQWEAFYEVFARHMRDLGTPVLPRLLFERIASLFQASVDFAVVYRGAEPVAAGCGFVWKGEFELTWASSLIKYKREAPNMLLYWALIERMIERGLHTFNFGRCTPGGGTHRFKLQWGGADQPLPWLQWSPGGVSGTPSPDRPIFRLATSLWRRLPPAVADRLGPVLARRLP